MSNKEIKFIAVDMDGTLLDHNGHLPEDFFPIYQKLSQRDITFAVASGRQYYSLRNTFAPICDQMMFIAENGTLVMKGGKQLYRSEISPNAVPEIINDARGINGAHIVLCGTKSAYIETRDPLFLKEVNKYFAHCQSVDDLLDVNDQIIKISICHFDGAEDYVFPLMNSKFGHSQQVVLSAKVWLDIMNANASKGAAIKYLQESLGFNHEQTMSFGDYLNDLEMLKVSHHSYAMENAHPKLKQIARFSAPSNREGGVITVIKKELRISS
ncbi:HAD family hydrolase [Photobacterium sp. DNB23_23_1]